MKDEGERGGGGRMWGGVKDLEMREVNKDLRARTKQYSLRVIRMFTSLPNTSVAQVLGKQVLRSATSVGAHYREGHRARSNAEFISKLEVALQELDESAYWLELLVEGEVFPAEKLADLIQETEELIAIFVTCVKKAKEH